MKHFRHVTYKDRILIAYMLLDKMPIKDIAAELGFSQATIYNEIKRAKYLHTNTDLTEEWRYNPDEAERLYQYNLRAKGSILKIDKDIKLANFIEAMIIENNYSPRAVLDFIRNNEDYNFDVEIKSVNTIYSYIKKGVFYGLTMKDCPQKAKKKKRRVKKTGKRQHGTSIEKRPIHILLREEFGHWEMDCVLGKKRNKKVLLVLTERKTRFEIIEVLKRHTLDEVVKALNRIEKRFGADFYKLFKTITVDNGSEFANQKRLEKALRRKNERTKIYYCHPYTSCERGSNEVGNKLIRRFFPKGSDFDSTVTTRRAKEVQDWMNEYPRGILNGKTSKEYFLNEYYYHIGTPKGSFAKMIC